MLLLRTLLVLAFILWIIFLWSRRKYYKLMFQLPGPMGLPLIGVAYKFRALEDLFHYSVELRTKHELPTLGWFGPFPVFVLADPINAQDILTSPHCVNKSPLYSPLSEMLGDGLITLANPKWLSHRRLLNPAFSPTNLRSFVPIFNEKTKAFLKDFENAYKGEPINVLHAIAKLTINMALQTTMDLKNYADRTTCKDIENKLFGYYHYIIATIMSFIMMPWLRLDIVQKFLPSLRPCKDVKNGLQLFFKNLIRKKCQILTANNAKAKLKLTTKKDRDEDLEQGQKFHFIDLTLELLLSGKFTAKDVEDHSNHIVAGAYETTATTIAHVLILLAMNPEYQQIAFEELFAIYPDRSDVTVTDEDILRLVYLEMVINETMRLIPTVPLVGRTASADVTLSSGIVLPAGVQIVVDIFDLHRDEKFWGPNGSVFNPENFLPENMEDKHPYAFIPFTKGIRTCIGSRYGMIATKVAVAILLRKYRFTTTGKFEELRYEPAISIKLIDPPLVKFHLREE